ncbi:TPA: hypothetical protein QEM39_000657 [Pseudomonas putida]|uniref:hypothetical protein n=1 Tax=Pseudomonas putida TaxID=303 RepID=UPI0023639759|nr:hypothetical protein [Pseudomonas putida]MDD2150768.1 hypothetical protein [Pseudomonas putida]HDS1679180.1 hypothetical protein [Pseudomonas putida]
MTAIILSFAVAGLVASIMLGMLMNRLRRRKATYKMYEVRDKFVLLVANDIITEDSPVFRYYYKRANMLLQYAPNIGIDHAFKAFTYQRVNAPKDFKEAICKAKQEAEKVMQSKDLELEEVADAVKHYYASNKEMVLAHSSVTRLLYYAISYGLVTEWLMRKVQVPESIKKALALVKVSGEEYNHINTNRFC